MLNIIGNTVLNRYLGGGSFDTDAALIFTAVGITDNTHKTAINNFVIKQKSLGIWNKLHAFYPMYGTTEESQKWNWKDPRDLDESFRLTWINDNIARHTTDGFSPSGLAYANTHFNPSLHALPSSFSMGYYSGSNIAGGTAVEMGAWNLVGPYLSFSGSTASAVNYKGVLQQAINNYDTRGIISLSRTSETSLGYYKNGFRVRDIATNDTTNSMVNLPIFIGGWNKQGTVANISSRVCSFAFIAEGLTKAEKTEFINDVEDLLTSWHRNKLTRLSSSTNEVIPLYLILGQSNVGRAQFRNISDNQYKGQIPNAFIYNKYHNEYFAPLTSGMNTSTSELTSFSTNYDEFGLQVSLASKLEQYASGKRAYFQFGIGSASLGSTGALTDWIKSANEAYPQMLASLTDAISKLIEKGYTPEIKAVIWMQGETDAKSSVASAAYATNLSQFMSDLQNDINNLIPVASIPKVIGRIKYQSATYRDAVRTAQFDYCDNTANNATMIDTDAYTMLVDNLHYNHDSQIQFGIDIFNVLKDL